eukprot:Pgem_evm1s19457
MSKSCRILFTVINGLLERSDVSGPAGSTYNKCDLSNMNITSISPNALTSNTFPHYDHFHGYFNLSHNQIVNIPSQTLNTLPHELIDLSYNLLESIPEDLIPTNDNGLEVTYDPTPLGHFQFNLNNNPIKEFSPQAHQYIKQTTEFFQTSEKSTLRESWIQYNNIPCCSVTALAMAKDDLSFQPIKWTEYGPNSAGEFDDGGSKGENYLTCNFRNEIQDLVNDAAVFTSICDSCINDCSKKSPNHVCNINTAMCVNVDEENSKCKAGEVYSTTSFQCIVASTDSPTNGNPTNENPTNGSPTSEGAKTNSSGLSEENKLIVIVVCSVVGVLIVLLVIGLVAYSELKTEKDPYNDKKIVIKESEIQAFDSVKGTVVPSVMFASNPNIRNSLSDSTTSVRSIESQRSQEIKEWFAQYGM